MDTPEKKTLNEIFDANKWQYDVDYYQREYKWGADQIEDLIKDLTEAFNENNKDSFYYLGTIILSDKDNRNKYIIDGQQRMTSLTLLFLFLYNWIKTYGSTTKYPEAKLDDVKRDMRQKIVEEGWGDDSQQEKTLFVMDVKDRISAIEDLYKQGQRTNYSNRDNISIENIYQRYEDIQNYFITICNNGIDIPKFASWLIKNVYLIVINASQKTAYNIFEVMNDRGLPVSPSEIFKGYLLSNVKEDDQLGANKSWIKMQTKIRELNDGKEDESELLRNILRSQYAIIPIQEGNDYDKFAHKTEFPKFFRKKAEEIGFTSAEAYYEFTTKTVPFFSDVYLKIKNAENVYTKELSRVYYLAPIKLGLWKNDLFFAPLSLADTPSNIDTKINLIAKYLDIYCYSKFVNGKKIESSHLSHFGQLINELRKYRNQSTNDLAIYLKIKAASHLADEFAHEKLSSLYLNATTKNSIRWLISRWISFLEREVDGIDNFKAYNTEPKNYDIEHLLSTTQFGTYQDYFKGEEEYDREREHISLLLLIRSSKNKSLQDKTYEDKLPKYFDDNYFVRTLHENAFENFPKFINILEQNSLAVAPQPKYNEVFVEDRMVFIEDLSKTIWSTKIFDENIEDESNHGEFQAVPTLKNIKKYTDISLLNLIKDNVIDNKKLTLEHDSKTITAYINDNGTISCNGHKGKLSYVLRKTTGKTSNGWDVWKYEGKKLNDIRKAYFKELKQNKD